MFWYNSIAPKGTQAKVHYPLNAYSYMRKTPAFGPRVDTLSPSSRSLSAQVLHQFTQIVQFILHLVFHASDRAIATRTSCQALLVGCVHVNIYPSGRNRAGRYRSGPLRPFDRCCWATALGSFVRGTTTGPIVSTERRGTGNYHTGRGMKSLVVHGTSLWRRLQL